MKNWSFVLTGLTILRPLF